MSNITREQILEMEAGKELDALIHKHIFGYEYLPHVSPKYSEEIADAWDVMEKFPISMVERVEVFEGRVTVTVSLYPSTESEKVYTVSSKSFELSVCRASLLAVMNL